MATLEERVQALETLLRAAAGTAPYNSSHTGPQIDSAISRALPGGEIDELLAGKAPDGYGLGKTFNYIIDCHDTTLKNGWYSLDGSGTINDPSLIPSSRYGVMFVQCRAPVRYHRVQYQGYVAQCFYDGSTWSPWEYINPPMKLGVEYRTTEWYRDKPVYVKLVAFGTLPNTGRTSIPHGIDNIENVISARGIESNGMSLPRFNVAYIWGDTINVNAESQADASSNSANILLKYTKTTN